MFGYAYPFYRSPYMFGGYPYGYGGFGGYPYGYGGYSSNVIGSAISNQNLVNTGTAVGVNQISTPTVIW